MGFSKEEKTVLLVCSEEPGCSLKGVAFWAKLSQAGAKEVLKSLEAKGLVYCEKGAYENGDDAWDITVEGNKALKGL